MAPAPAAPQSPARVSRPSGGPHLLRAAKQQWRSIGPLLKDTALYLDAGAAEAVAAGVGVSYLLGLGVAFIGELGAATVSDASVGKLLSGCTPIRIVTVTTQMLIDTHSSILQAALVHPSATQVTVLCGVSENAHASYPACDFGEEAFKEYAAILHQDISQAHQQRMVPSQTSADPPTKVRPSAAASKWEVELEVSVLHFALPICPISPAAFVLPAASFAASRPRFQGSPAGWLGKCDSSAQQQSPSGGRNNGEVDDDDDDEVDVAAAGGLTALADALAAIMRQIGAKTHVWALGPTSSAIARELVSLPAPPSDTKAPAHAAALVLVDRSLDLMAPALHGDHVLDRAFAMLGDNTTAGNHAVLSPVRNADVVVHMGGREVDRVEGGIKMHSQPLQPLPGCLLHPADDQAAAWMAFLARKPAKEALLFLRKWLREALRAEDVKTTLRFRPGTVPPEELRALADALSTAPGATSRHGALLQYAVAAAASFSGSRAAHWDMLQRKEHALIRAAAEGPDAMIAELLEVLRLANLPEDESPSTLTLPDALQLARLGHCLTAITAPPAHAHGPHRLTFSVDDDRIFKEALVECLRRVTVADESRTGPSQNPSVLRASLGMRLERTSTPTGDEDVRSNVTALTAGYGTQEYAARVVAGMQHQSQACSKAYSIWQRQHLRHLSEPAADTAAPAPRHFQPLLSCLTGAILDKQRVPELQHFNDSLSSLLKSGLGHFGLHFEAPPQPSDHPVVIIFVVGGISMREIREVQVLVDNRKADVKSAAILVGGTSLLAPSGIAMS